jgi:hypothetical protein
MKCCKTLKQGNSGPGWLLFLFLEQTEDMK